MKADVVVIGGGLVGLSTAMQLGRRFPGLGITVLEKEAAVAAHQSGHNSGVVHAGVYYAPGSLKARFCREGSARTYAFARDHGVSVERCGKLIVATSDAEIPRLRELASRARQSGLDPEWCDASRLAELEPRISGRAAILVHASGIVDYPAIARAMADDIRARGGEVRLSCRVLAIREEPSAVELDVGAEVLRARYVVACAGATADRLLAMCGVEPDFRIVPFRGEYFRLPASKDRIVRHLIYPVPDPALPFLGVHLTRMAGGFVTVGPNAVLALSREGYRRRDISGLDMAQLVAFGGFWRLIRRHWRSAARELATSLSRRLYLAACRRYCPELTLDDLQPHPAGVRAMAVDARGEMMQDFELRQTRRTLHVCSAPSPAATAALPIGAHLTEYVAAALADR